VADFLQLALTWSVITTATITIFLAAQISLTVRKDDIRGEECRNSTGDGNTTLVDVAEETLRNGKTLYERSLAGTVRGNDSVMGDEQSVIQAGNVGSWVETVNKLRRVSREGCIAEIELPSGFSDDGRDTAATFARRRLCRQGPKRLE
jgi:hypothetical protein